MRVALYPLRRTWSCGSPRGGRCSEGDKLRLGNQLLSKIPACPPGSRFSVASVARGRGPPERVLGVHRHGALFLVTGLCMDIGPKAGASKQWIVLLCVARDLQHYTHSCALETWCSCLTHLRWPWSLVWICELCYSEGELDPTPFASQAAGSHGVGAHRWPGRHPGVFGRVQFHEQPGRHALRR